MSRIFARMKSLFLSSVCSLCWYVWIVIRSVLSSISEKEIDGDSEAFHYKWWFLIVMAHFWSLLSSPLFQFCHQNWTQCSKVLLVPNTAPTPQPFRPKPWWESLRWAPALRAWLPAAPSVHTAQFDMLWQLWHHLSCLLSHFIGFSVSCPGGI